MAPTLTRARLLSELRGGLLIRLNVALLFIIHGVSRTLDHGVLPFGDFLTSQHLPLGKPLAIGITIFEVLGGLTLATGRYVRVIALLFVVHQLGGIAMVHAQHGWFVVGGGTYGVEYSVLIISACATLAAMARGWGAKA